LIIKSPVRMGAQSNCASGILHRRRRSQPAAAAIRASRIGGMTPRVAERMTAGAIVRHADYPQWGLGYVIRAKKSSTDVFFQWGGKRKISAGEPIEASDAVGVEMALFTLCAAHSAQSWSAGRHNLYAIELDRAVWKNRAFRERNPGGAGSGC